MPQWGEALQSMSPAAAPAAGKPGMGQGNIPFAPGVMSGQYPGLTDGANNFYQRLSESRPMQTPQQDVGGVAMPTAGPQQPGPMAWGPEQQAATLQYLMSLLQPGSPATKVTTTGGFMQSPNEQY